MNFIVIISDSLRRDYLGCCGNKWISTPHIDAFADKSLVFDKAYCASFPTVPHRRDVLTGRYTFTYTRWAPLSADEVVLAYVLGQNGYLSMMVCDCPHILENGYHYDRGFDGFEWIRGAETDRWRTQPREIQHPCNPLKIRAANSYIKHHRRNVSNRRYEEETLVARTMTEASRWLERNYKEKNFFLYVDTFDPHEPWDAPKWYVDMYDPGYTGEEVDYPLYGYIDYLSKEELKHCRALYSAKVTLVDRWVGMLLEKIEDMGLFENTTIIFMADHGFLLGEHNIMGKAFVGPEYFSYCPLYDEINHIPFIVHLPDCKPRRSKAIIQPPDIMATIIDLSGSTDPGTIHGKSFASVLKGDTDECRSFAVSSPAITAGGSGGTSVTIVKGNYFGILSGKPIPETGDGDKAIDGKEKTYAVAIRADGFIKSYVSDKPSTEDFLFDISKDPKQENDLKDQHPEILNEMRRDFLDLLKETGTKEKLIEPWR